MTQPSLRDLTGFVLIHGIPLRSMPSYFQSRLRRWIQSG
jgi:hypothetical protein